MQRLLAIEFQKLWMNRSSRILTLSYFVLLSFIAMFSIIKFDIGDFQLHLADMGIFNFPFIWHFNTYIADFLNFYLVIVVVSMVANEYSYNTLKQNLIDGMTKLEFLLSKWLTCVAIAAAGTIYIFVMSLILGYIYSSYTETAIVFSELEYLLAYFVKSVGFFTFSLFAAFLVRRSAFAIGFIILWSILEGIIRGLVYFQLSEKVGDFLKTILPFSNNSNLISEPFTRLSVVKTMGETIGVDRVFDYSVSLLSIFISIGWTAVFFWLSYLLLKKRDL